jgi:selenoprotein W-related protein
LHKVFNVSAKLIPGSNGIFDVVIDGQLIFSRSEDKRFPEPGEIIRRLLKTKQ